MLKSMTITAVPAVRRRNAALIAAESGVPVLDVVVPVYNEQAALADSVHRLHRHLREDFPFSFRITIADNASTDDTPRIAAALAGELTDVRVVRLEEKGRGRALHTVWSASDAHGAGLHGRRPVDRPGRAGAAGRAADLRALRPGHRHPARPRLTGGARRQARVHLALLQPDPALDAGARGSPTRSAGSRRSAPTSPRELLPHVADTGWFFDTELLVLAERSGLRIHEVPVDWVDDPDSRVDIVATAIADLKGIGRLLRASPPARSRCRPSPPSSATAGRRTAVAAAPGGAVRRGRRRCPPLAYLVLFLVLRPHRRPGRQPGGAAGDRRSPTPRPTGASPSASAARAKAARHHFEGLIVFAIGLAITSGALAVLHALGEPSPRRRTAGAGRSPI